MVRHAFVNPKSDGGDATITRPSDWNADHDTDFPGMFAGGNELGYGGGGITEEYDSGTTGLSWSPTTPGTIDSNSTIPSHLYAAWTGSGSTETLGLRAWSPTGAAAFDARMMIGIQKNDDGNSNSAGLIITSSGDTSRALIQLNALRATYQIQCFTYAASTYTQRGTNHSSLGAGMPYHLRITRDGSNNVTFYYSALGRGIWTQLTTLSFTFTVANIGIRLAENGTSTTYLYSDYLRTNV